MDVCYCNEAEKCGGEIEIIMRGRRARKGRRGGREKRCGRGRRDGRGRRGKGGRVRKKRTKQISFRLFSNWRRVSLFLCYSYVTHASQIGSTITSRQLIYQRRRVGGRRTWTKHNKARLWPISAPRGYEDERFKWMSEGMIEWMYGWMKEKRKKRNKGIKE